MKKSTVKKRCSSCKYYIKTRRKSGLCDYHYFIVRSDKGVDVNVFAKVLKYYICDDYVKNEKQRAS